jgi:uncharacterized LabA/DUF88 family protein
MRYQALLAEGRTPIQSNVHIQDVFIWQPGWMRWRPLIDTDIFRVNYYTSMVGDDDAIASLCAQISRNSYSGHGDCYGTCQQYPRVYKKLKRSTKSRLVDINITIDSMRHAYSDAVDVIYLLSGDGDFVHLVEELARSGKKVCLGAFSSGLEPRLKSCVDRFVLLDDLFFEPLATPLPVPPPPTSQPVVSSPTTSQ